LDRGRDAGGEAPLPGRGFFHCDDAVQMNRR